jgi:hypothetical protein
MATIIQPNQVLTIQFGLLVTKAAATLPQTATATLYTVAGGNVLVTSMFGLVSGTAMGATATTLAIGTAPTTGTAETAGIATATAVTSLEIGSWVSVQSSSGVGGALVSGGHAGTVVFAHGTTSFVVAPGTITWTTSASDTGKMAWYLTYIPLDTGASVS